MKSWISVDVLTSVCMTFGQCIWSAITRPPSSPGHEIITQGPRKWFPQLLPGSSAASGVSPLKESLCPVLNSRRRCLSEGCTRGGNVTPSRISGRWMRCQSGHKVHPSVDTQTAVVWKMLIFFCDEAALTLAENCAVHYFQRHCCCGYCRAIFSALLTSGRGTR